MDGAIEVVAQPWANMTATGALIILLIYLVTRALPAMIKAFTEATKEQRDDFRDEMRLEREENSVLQRELHAEIRNLATEVSKG